MMKEANHTLYRTAANETRLAQLRQALAELLEGSLRRGFFGSVQLELTVQDGTIQHIRRRVEQLEK